MIIGTNDNRPSVILGLSRRNCELLLSGKPIEVDVAKMGGPNMTIVLLAGESEQHIVDELQAFDLISKDTPRHVQEPVQPGEFGEGVPD